MNSSAHIDGEFIMAVALEADSPSSRDNL